MSWKKRNQQLRGPKPRKAKPEPKVYLVNGVFYADPRHGLEITNVDGTWHYRQNLSDGGALVYLLKASQKDIEKYDEYPLGPPAHRAAVLEQTIIRARDYDTNSHQIYGKRRRRNKAMRAYAGGYKAMPDAMGGFNARDWKNHFDLAVSDGQIPIEQLGGDT